MVPQIYFSLLMIISFTVSSHGQSRTPEIIRKNALFEIAFTSEEKVKNPFWDAQVSAKFTSPNKKTISIEGFYFGEKEWRVRFVPEDEGEWTYSAKLKIGNKSLSKNGTFICKGKYRNGYLQISKKNPYRMEYKNGKPFYPIGIQTCGYFNVGFDGPEAKSSIYSMVSAKEWCVAFEGAVNLIRWQIGAGTKLGCALELLPINSSLDKYDTELAKKMDNLLKMQREHGFSHIMILFQDMSLWANSESSFGKGRDLKNYKSLQAKNLPEQEKYIRYIVARFSCYVDIWELFNEDSFSPNDYLAHLANVIKKYDPYKHLLTTNYSRPDQKFCEIITFHEYCGMPANEVDNFLSTEFGKLKSYGKVIQNTEFGNQGWLSNYDPIKWRISVWASFFNEGGLLFWGMSGKKTIGKRPYKGNANAYIGKESRQYFRVFNKFNKDLPIDMRPILSGYTEHNDIRIYALSNGKISVVYIHHFSDHNKSYQFPDPLYLQTGPGKYKITWINPEDGKVIKVEEQITEHQYLIIKKIPAVKIDLACRMDLINTQ
jgi:hypothetical protein